jgi:hypothetical protein
MKKEEIGKRMDIGRGRQEEEGVEIGISRMNENKWPNELEKGRGERDMGMLDVWPMAFNEEIAN